MAYFSSATESMDWATQNCDLCRHQDGPDAGSVCAVWLLHLLRNYDQCAHSDAARAYADCLGTLIPRTRDGLGNERCLMFIAKE